ncbi:MAG: TetM/TetW/TetO/TetS family tetracycline resistance ribosomal protection protein [Lachnospiraceae bacterium]
MDEVSENKPEKYICTAMLAHVDAGKTTLSENILYQRGVIRSAGRVDHGNTFLDTDHIERERGITIYAKEAVFELGDKTVCLIDTPGHGDFSAEMERILQIIDYAILVVSGTDGVQAHARTLWKLFDIYNIPVFIFVNKMDQSNSDKIKVMKDIESLTGGLSIDFSDVTSDKTREAIAVTDEALFEGYMETGAIEDKAIVTLISQRKIFPVFFGSALKGEGVGEFLDGFDRYTVEKTYGNRTKAKIFKIAHDDKGARLTYVKLLGGELLVKSVVRLKTDDGKIIEDKIDQIRIYSGDKYTAQTSVRAGMVCALTGLAHTKAGQTISETENKIYEIEQSQVTEPVIEPVLMYRMALPKGCDTLKALRQIRELEEEEPQLKVIWNKYLDEIYVRVMGRVQIEILKSVIYERFSLEVEFDSGNIVYKETIDSTVEGVGHFEPLRHYAEVHLLMEPLKRGAGLIFAADCSEDILDRNWQNLILTHLKEREHLGVLTGSPLTDMKITLMSGRAHQKHTEGGDFRQATYRAVRQGLMEAESQLLEPYYSFQIELPTEMIGRAMTDIQRMYGTSQTTENNGEMAVLTGTCPVSTMCEYQTELISYTKGRGKIFLTVKGYDKCHNSQEVIENTGYAPDADGENPTGSVFCANGAGFYVPWNEVKSRMHMESVIKSKAYDLKNKASDGLKNDDNIKYYGGEDELEEIFERTFKTSYHGIREPEKEKAYNPYKKTNTYGSPGVNKTTAISGGRQRKAREDREEYLLVDGYNIIFAWEELRELSKVNMDSARVSLLEIMCNYQGFTGVQLIVVFDAYKVQGNKGSVEKYKNIYAVYTREAETADQYIEKTVHNIGKKHRVTVATSDRLEQMIILGDGAVRLSAAGLKDEVERVVNDIRSLCR